MSPDGQTSLSDAEVDAFLGERGAGVLALASGGDPYAVPVSYGYDPADRQCYLRLVSTLDSEKRAFLSSTPAARLVVYEHDGSTYRSVVVTGRLRELPRTALTVDDVEQYGDTPRPLFEALDDPRRDLDVSLYVLDPETLSGRRAVPDGALDGTRGV